MARKLRSESEWRGILEKWKGSGLGVKEFCKAEGVGENRFYEIRKRIEAGKKKKEAVRQAQFVPVEIKAVTEEMVEQKSSGYLEIVTPSGHMVRIH